METNDLRCPKSVGKRRLYLEEEVLQMLGASYERRGGLDIELSSARSYKEPLEDNAGNSKVVKLLYSA